MTIEITKDELEDLDLRQVLQDKLQEATRRSASPSEINRIQQEIEKLNQKLEAYQSRAHKR